MLIALVVLTPKVAYADDYVSITGAGSTWSEVAIRAWSTDVQKNGLTVNYQGGGSTAGRTQYIYGTVDFAVSEIPFQPDEHPARPYAYLPVVAGGTSFMYHLTVAGKRVEDLRLSGETITKIFTGVITNWSDPEITADYGKQLPNLTIQPIIRSDGSGTSAQLTLYMSKQYPALWNDFCVAYAGQPNCGLQSIYPQFPGSKSQQGSNGVSNYVAASYGEGAITYVEYAYALGLAFPVAKVLNAGGYYTLPTASNVAVALNKAEIDPVTLTQELTPVYNNTDTRTYPLSSYSYMIVPTTTASPFNEQKGRSLSTFINYFLCDGQQKADNLGYSPLPINLVKSGFDQVRKIPGFVEPPSGDLSACNNPTFQGGKNVLLDTAPYPSECDKLGSAPDCVVGGGATGSTPQPSTPTGSQGTGTGVVATPGAGGTATGTTADVGGDTPPLIDPESGLEVTGATGTDSGVALAAVQDPGAFRNASAQTRVVYGLTGAELLLAVIIPPLMAILLRRRRIATLRDDREQ